MICGRVRGEEVGDPKTCRISCTSSLFVLLSPGGGDFVSSQSFLP